MNAWYSFIITEEKLEALAATTRECLEIGMVLLKTVTFSCDYKLTAVKDLICYSSCAEK